MIWRDLKLLDGSRKFSMERINVSHLTSADALWMDVDLFIIEFNWT